jgi:hypothetical protein
MHGPCKHLSGTDRSASLRTVAFWANRARAAIRAGAEALFPKNEIGAPDHVEAEVEQRTWEYIEMLPGAQRRLIVMLFVFVELVAPLVALKLGRYSKLDPEARCDVVRRFRGSRAYLLKLIGDSVKAVLTMSYMAHPAVVRHIGQYSVCEHADGFRVEVKKNALATFTRPPAADAKGSSQEEGREVSGTPAR